MKNILVGWIKWFGDFLGFTNNESVTFTKDKSGRKFVNVIHIGITTEIQERLNYLMHRYEIRSTINLFKKALALFDLLSDHLAGGGKIILRDANGGEQELDIIEIKPPDDN